MESSPGSAFIAGRGLASDVFENDGDEVGVFFYGSNLEGRNKQVFLRTVIDVIFLHAFDVRYDLIW